MINAIDREIPDKIEGYNKVVPFKGALRHIKDGFTVNSRRTIRTVTGRRKVVKSLKEVLHQVGLKDGMTVSFHHHLRNGDYVTNMVFEAISQLGIKQLKLAHSAIFDVHEPVLQHIKNSVITRIETDYISDGFGTKLCLGMRDSSIHLDEPIKLLTHGGRARRIESGDTHIDVAFIAAPSADDYGNINGVDGPSACGSLGLVYPDAEFADQVVAVTDNLVDYPLPYISIDQTYVDYVVRVDKIGEPAGIESGATRQKSSPVNDMIAYRAARIIDASGLLENDVSFQTGTGGISLTTTYYLRKIMTEKNVVGSFGLGGITGYFVELLEEGRLRALLDAQCFDMESIKSLKVNPNHIEIGASMYANPHTRGCVVNKLDISVLSATEIDVDFNVNVTTSSYGMIMGGSGGHSDSSAGSKLCLIVAPVMRNRIPIVMDKVTTVTTPGETVDALVTERGIAVNPRRQDLTERFKEAKLPVVAIEELKDYAYKHCGEPRSPNFKDKVIAVQEYRDGTIIDVIRELK
ncbi:citrate lyase subunit alpha [Chloroflexota bacterium]